MVRPMLLKSQLPSAFWAEPLATATYIRNRLPTKSLPYSMSPHEAWFGKMPAILHIRQFGYITFSHVPHEKPKKLDARSKQYILGSVSTTSYRLFDPESRRIFTSRDVAFKENTFLPQSAFNVPILQAKFEVLGIDDIPTPAIPASPAIFLLTLNRRKLHLPLQRSTPFIQFRLLRFPAQTTTTTTNSQFLLLLFCQFLQQLLWMSFLLSQFYLHLHLYRYL